MVRDTAWTQPPPLRKPRKGPSCPACGSELQPGSVIVKPWIDDVDLNALVNRSMRGTVVAALISGFIAGICAALLVLN